jgi:L-fuculose-phosphate aldolase
MLANRPESNPKLKTTIIQLGKFLFDKGYIVATDGNISVRLNLKEILITRTGVCKGEMKMEDIIRLSLRGAERRGNPRLTRNEVMPSSEYRFHLAIYKNRPDINAIIHAHPPYSTIFAVTGKKLDSKLLTETEETLGKIKQIGYFIPGSLELANAISKASLNHNVMILAHHGIIVFGQDLIEARYRLERLEFLSKVTLLASLIKF